MTGPGSAIERLGRWLDALAATKQRMAREDAELFATFRRLTEEAREVVAAHVDHLAGQAARIVADGVAAGELADVDPSVTGARCCRRRRDSTTRLMPRSGVTPRWPPTSRPSGPCWCRVCCAR